jgi:hypothetical protein
MPINLTITAQSGPARVITAGVFNGGTGLLILPDRKILQFFTGGDTNSPPEKEFDLTGVTTLTCVISGANYNVTVS